VYRYGGRFVHNDFGAGSGEILLDHVRCTGTETDISQCHHSGWNVHDCGHEEDVSVSCNTGINYEQLAVEIIEVEKLTSNYS